MVEKMTLGKYISKKRIMLNMTQEELAKRMNVSKSAVAKWETNAGIPNRDNIEKLAVLINVSIDEIFRIISLDYGKQNNDINITDDVINILKAYGYEVSRKK